MDNTLTEEQIKTLGESKPMTEKEINSAIFMKLLPERIMITLLIVGAVWFLYQINKQFQLI